MTGVRGETHCTDRGDLRFAVTLLNHAVFNDPGDERARRDLAALHTRLGHRVENAVWRNFYLTGAQELAHGVTPGTSAVFGSDLQQALTIGQLVDGMAVRVNGPEAWTSGISVDWHIGEEYWHLRLANGVLTRTSGPRPSGGAGLTMTMTEAQLLRVLAGRGIDGVTMDGDPPCSRGCCRSSTNR